MLSCGRSICGRLFLKLCFARASLGCLPPQNRGSAFEDRLLSYTACDDQHGVLSSTVLRHTCTITLKAQRQDGYVLHGDSGIVIQSSRHSSP